MNWPAGSHERSVEAFYSTGARRFGEFHGGYLNFGLWRDAETYVQAAEGLVRSVCVTAGIDSTSRLLDVACGMGAQDVLIMDTFAPRAIDAVDVTLSHVRSARDRAWRAHRMDRIKAHHGTATRLKFPADAFTHLVSIEGPVHFDTRQKFMREAYRVLKPGGVMVLADYALKREPRSLFEKFLLRFMTWLWKIPRENCDTIARYREKLERTGFKNISFREIGKHTIPGYCREQSRPETVAALAKIRGRFAAIGGGFLDLLVKKAFAVGLIDYIIVRAVK